MFDSCDLFKFIVFIQILTNVGIVMILYHEYNFFTLYSIQSNPLISSIKIYLSSFKVCWIFDTNAKYQLMISFFSLIYNNPSQKFIFYFIIPENMKLDLRNYSLLLNHGSEIRIRNFHDNQTYLSNYPTKCEHSRIIIAKLFLCEILPDVDKILYLDSDMINTAPITQLTQLSLENKTLAGTFRPWIKWMNSGFIYYNLNYLRKQPKSLWDCANVKFCYVDDNWHTNCHGNLKIVLPYRYNVELFHMNDKNKNSYHIDEENKTTFVHMMGKMKEFYSVFDNYDKYIQKEAKNCKIEIEIFLKLFKMKEIIDNEIFK